MIQSAAFITTSRRHLFNIASALFQAVNPVYLDDAENPLIVVMNGTVDSGKSIFVDEACNALFNSQGGKKTVHVSDYQENCYKRFIHGRSNEYDREIHMMDIVDFETYEKCGSEKVRMFMEGRRSGGITFLQNFSTLNPKLTGHIDTERPPLMEPSICVTIENPDGDCRFYKPRIATLGLYDRFNRIAKPRLVQHWNRYVEIDILNPMLARSPGIQAVMSQLTPKEEGRVFIYGRHRKIDEKSLRFLPLYECGSS